MRVLAVIDRIFAAEFFSQIDIEVKMGITTSGNKEITDGIDTDLFDEFFHGDGVSGTFAHLEFFAVLEKPDHLNQRDDKMIGIVSKILLGGFKTGDISMMIGTE